MNYRELLNTEKVVTITDIENIAKDNGDSALVQEIMQRNNIQYVSQIKERIFDMINKITEKKPLIKGEIAKSERVSENGVKSMQDLINNVIWLDTNHELTDGHYIAYEEIPNTITVKLITEDDIKRIINQVINKKNVHVS